MESKTTNFAQLFLRIAIALSFLSAVADRFGFWGAPGSIGASWGNWENFVAYSNTLNSYLSPPLGKIAAVTATSLEVLFALLLLIGYQTKLAAIGSAVLLFTFAITMTISLGIKPPFDYSVWIGVGANLLLSTISKYKYSLDNLVSK